MYQQTLVNQAKNDDLQNSHVESHPIEFEFTEIDISNDTVENSSFLDSFPPDLFTGMYQKS